MNKLREWLTPGKSNTWDLMYLVLLVAVVEYLWKTWHMPVFDPTGFGTGFAALIASGAGLQWYNNKEDKDAGTTRDVLEANRGDATGGSGPCIR